MRKWTLRLTALILAFCLLLCGCTFFEDQPWEGDALGYIPYEDMVYERPDMAAFDTRLQDIRDRLASGRSVIYLVRGINSFMDLYNDFYTNMSLADIHYYADLTDPEWEAEHNFCLENQNVAEAKLDELYRLLAASEYREDLESDSYFGEGFFDYYDGETYWDETYTALAEEEARLQNRYYDLSSQALEVEYYSEEYFSQYGTQLAQLYVELIAVRQELAAYLGYDSYVDFAYENYYYRDYTAAQAEQYFQMIGKELQDVYCRVNNSDVWEGGAGYSSEDATFRYVKNAAQRMGGRISEAFDLLEKAQLYDIGYGENKYNVSFEVFLDAYGQPFVFTCPAMQAHDKLVFAHEFGHFVNDYVCSGSFAGTDIAEIHSGAMEYLSICYTDDAQELEKYKLADSLCLFVEQSAFALFEQQVYSLTGDDLTVENVQKLYEQIGTDFGFDSWAWDARDYVTMPHIFTYPMYIASYVVSNDLAFQIYQLEKAEAGAGLEVYMKCLESQDSYIMYFAETYGLENPFTPKRVTSVRKTFEEVLLPE